jgi:hypothetical protein
MGGVGMAKMPFRVGDTVNYAFDAPFPWRRRINRWWRAALVAIGLSAKQRFFRVVCVEEGSITVEVIEK